MQYLIARLREPGTMRSLAVVLFALWGLSPDDARLEAAIQVGILLLGTVSALIPEKGVKAVEAVQNAASTAREASELAVSAAQEAKAVTNRAAGVVEGIVGRPL